MLHHTIDLRNSATIGDLEALAGSVLNTLSDAGQLEALLDMQEAAHIALGYMASDTRVEVEAGERLYRTLLVNIINDSHTLYA